MRRSRACWLISALLISVSPLIYSLPVKAQENLSDQDWQQFRGPNGNGVLDAIAHPLEWNAEKNVAWSVDIPGGGWSSPLIVGDKVFLTTAAGPYKPVGFAAGVTNMTPQKPTEPLTFQAMCLNLSDGSEVWTTPLSTAMPKHGVHPSNSFATATPVTDGKNVFVYFASTGVVASLDLDGNEIWRNDVGVYSTGAGFGPGSSPAIFGEQVYIQCDNAESSFIVAFNKSDGKERWRKDRKSRTSWSTPLIWKNKNRVELIACGSGFATSYNPETGEENWTVSGIESAFSATPAADDERIYLGNSGPGSSGPLLSIESTMTGTQEFKPDTEFPGLAWSRMQSGPGMQSPVSVGGFLYITGRGTLRCYSTSDGKELFKARVDGMKSGAASLWADQERLFILDEAGNTFVVQAGDKFELLGVNKLNDLFWSTPAVSGSSLLLRSADKLYCIRKIP